MALQMKNTLFLFVIVSAAGSGGLHAESQSAGGRDGSHWFQPQNWQRDKAEPCLSLGEDGTFDSEHIHAPCVFIEDGRYVMLYTGADEPVQDRVMEMGIAFSRDGKHFERHPGNPVLSIKGRQITTPMVLRRPDGSVLRENGDLRVWFTGTGDGEDRDRTFLMETRSKDGLTWSTPKELDMEYAYAPTILKEGETYKMWYTDARRDPWPMRYAESRDGTQWRVHPEPVLEVDQDWERTRLFYPTVLKRDGTYLMWYGSYQKRRKGEGAKTALGFAVSPDGIRWTKYAGNPVFGPDASRAWESHYTTSQTILPLADGSWRIWYASRSKPPFVHKYFAIGTARWEGFSAKARASLAPDHNDRSRTIRVAGIMNPPVREGDYREANYRAAESLIREAARAGADLVCTYEQFLDGYGFDANKITNMRDERVARYEVFGESDYIDRLAALARELEIVIVAGIGLKQDDDCANSALIFDAGGSLVGTYRKTHNRGKEARWFAPLSDDAKKTNCPSFEIGPGRVSVKICNDRHFSETTEFMMANGGELILAPSFGKYDPSRLVEDTKEFGVWAVFVHPQGTQFIHDGKIIFEQRVKNGEGSIALQDIELAAPRTEGAPSSAEVKAAMKKAAVYFREKYAQDGGYPRTRELDPKRTKPYWGRLENAAPIGMAYLNAYRATGDPFYLDVPREAAHALAWNQLASGGWHHKMNEDPERAATFYYRRDVEAGQTDQAGRTNHTVLDDDVSQSAARLLMLYDRATGFQEEKVHHAARYALRGFADLQYSSGGWPMWVQRSKQVEAVKARYPESWKRTYKREFYPPLYTINDGAIPKTIDALLLGYLVYGDAKYLESARRGGDFLILAQMPEPQPAWCQQYTLEMTPAWARKFEPPAIVSYESIDVIESLMKLYLATGEEKYRAPIGPALDWLERSCLDDGRFARFYELKTNRPLYFTTDYEMVYTDDDLPTHYRFKWDIDVEDLRHRWAGLEQNRRETFEGDDSDGKRLAWMLGRRGTVSADTVRSIIEAMDAQGEWSHERYSPARMFMKNINVLSLYIASRE